ncbi:MAG: leucine-rich repeat protein [Oscillospiraceae bacterium]|nr:leucine-rich repeat protein [Oscillospiraceae bacterium]
MYEYLNCPWEDYRSEIVHVTIGEGITGLGSYLFAAMPALETVVLPDSTETIGIACFKDCTKLDTINIPEGAEFLENVFDGDTALIQEVGDFQLIGDLLYSYVGNTGLYAGVSVTVPDGVRVIGNKCFFGKYQILDVTLPDSVTEIQDLAFYLCNQMTAINLPDSLTSIGDKAFMSCTVLEDIAIPESVTEIGDYAFFATGIKSVSVPDSVTALADHTFDKCQALTSVTLGDNVESIGAECFSDCKKLTEIHLPDTLRSIGVGAFSGCAALDQNYRTVAGSVLDGKLMLTLNERRHEITIPEGVTMLVGASQEDSAKQTTLFGLHCPDSMISLEEYALTNYTGLMELELNDGLQRIGKNAISGCNSLHELTIPASVTEIGTQDKLYLTDLYGTPGTAAEAFANENGIRFHNAAERQLSGQDMTLDFSRDVWYFGNSGTAFNGQYYLTGEDEALARQFAGEKAGIFTDPGWSGSCFGLSLSVILAKCGIIPLNALQSGAQCLSEIEPTPQIQSMINYYQCVQYGNAYVNANPGDSKLQRLYRLIRSAEQVSQGGTPALLLFSMGSGMHAMIGYGAETGSWEWNGKVYDSRILVWDSNSPQQLSEGACVYYDSVTYEYAIPAYNVYDDGGSSGVGIVSVCSDLSVMNSYPYPFPAISELPGDVDENGAVDVRDAVLLARMVAEDNTVQYTEQGKKNADLDGDERIRSADLTVLLRMLAGLQPIT